MVKVWKEAAALCNVFFGGEKTKQKNNNKKRKVILFPRYFRRN